MAEEGNELTVFQLLSNWLYWWNAISHVSSKDFTSFSCWVIGYIGETWNPPQSWSVYRFQLLSNWLYWWNQQPRERDSSRYVFQLLSNWLYWWNCHFELPRFLPVSFQLLSNWLYWWNLNGVYWPALSLCFSCWVIGYIGETYGIVKIAILNRHVSVAE